MANGLVFIASTSFTTQSSVSIDNCFSAAYTHYIVKSNLLASIAETDMTVRLRVASTDASGADYRYQYVHAASTSIAGARGTGQTSMLRFGSAEATAAGYREMWISNPFEAVRTTAWMDYSNSITGGIYMWSFVNEHDLTTSYDGFTVTAGAGTITGSISVWGLVKA